MEERIRKLERRQMFMMAVCVMLLVPVLIGMTREPRSDRIKLNRLQIVDDNGKALVELSADKLGGRMAIRSAHGKDVVVLKADDNGGAMSTFQTDGKIATYLHTYQVNSSHRAGAVETYDWNGQSTVTLGTGFKGTGSVSMGAGCGGGVLVVAEKGGDMMRVDLCLLRELAKLHLNDGS